MKNKFIALFLTLLLIPAMAFAANPDVGKTEKPDVKDAALAFILEKAKDYSGKAEVAVGKAVDFVVAETPLVIKEFLTWRAWKHGGIFVLSLAFFSISAFILIFGLRGWPKDKYGDYDPSPLQITVVVISGFATFFGLITFAANFDHLFSFIQIQVAPRIYLIEQASALLK